MCNCLSDLTAPATQTIKRSDNQAIIKFFFSYVTFRLENGSNGANSTFIFIGKVFV